MGVEIYKTPQRRDFEDFSYSTNGNVLEINGEIFDLNGRNGSFELDNEFVFGNVFLKGEDFYVRLIIPHLEGEEPCEHDEMPEYASPPTIQDYQAAIRQLVEETAQSKQYDSAANMASYVSSTVPVWAAQAQTFVAWRDAVWQYTYRQLEQFQLGLREQPSVADFLTELPVIDWNEQ